MAQGFVDPQAEMRRILLRNIERVQNQTRWQPLPHQVPPPGDWRGWLLLAGRGAGKTEACARYVVDHVNGPPCLDGPIPHWIGIIAPTGGDAVTACYQGPSGIRHFDPSAILKVSSGGTVINWPNGSQAKLYGCREPDDVERLRAGGNTCLAWLEELAAWRYLQDAYDQMKFGLRMGPKPRWIGSTTPKPKPLIKKMAKGEVRSIVVTKGVSMYDNPYLAVEVREDLEEAYAGTALGSQELYGRLVEQDENALWSRQRIDQLRWNEAPEDIRRIVIGVDPSGGQGEQGIVVDAYVKRREEKEDGKPAREVTHGLTLDDRTVTLGPDGWGRAAVQAAIDWEADAIAVETNFGGDMAVSTITSVEEDMGVYVPVKTVHASRGKAPRAQPVAAMSVQGRWHMVGEFPELEDQLCTWTVDGKWSPDRLDAMVWPAWQMKLVSTVLRSKGVFGGKAMTARKLVRA